MDKVYHFWIPDREEDEEEIRNSHGKEKDTLSGLMKN
jgi:hypothetical protein